MGGSTTSYPTSTNNWEELSTYQCVIADTIFGDAANIGGFITNDEKMTSKSNNLTLDGKNGNITISGKLKATDAEITGVITATSGSITGNLTATGKITFGSTNKLEIDGSNANIIGYTGNDVSIRLGYNSDKVNNFAGAGLYLYRADDYVSFFRRHDWCIWSYDNYELAKISASCNGASELMDFYHNNNNKFTFGLTSSGMFTFSVSSISMIKSNRDNASVGELFIGSDECLRIKLKN